MKKIIIIDSNSTFTHVNISNKSVGSSEYQLYNLIKNLLLDHKIVCYNKIKEETILDGVLYLNYSNLERDELMKKDIILINKYFPINTKILNKIIKNKIFFWIHNLIEDKIFLNNESIYVKYFKENQEQLKKLLDVGFLKRNIFFILNSNFTKKLFSNYFNKHNLVIDEKKIIVINNILYNNDFIKIKNTKFDINTYNLVYASDWEKGIWDIIKLFDYILSKDKNFILTLLSPTNNIETQFKQYKNTLKEKYGNNINIIGSVNKEEYSKVIKSSLCVLTSKFSETFGSVFAESLYLGTPVIGDINSGAVPEIVGHNFIVNYDNLDQFYNKLMEIKNNRSITNVKLNEKYLFDKNFLLWIENLNN
jgi:hypothetical protein